MKDRVGDLVCDPPAMDSERFLRELSGLVEDFPRSEHPRVRRLSWIADEVQNLARENNIRAPQPRRRVSWSRRGVRRGRRVPRGRPDRRHARERPPSLRRDRRQLRLPGQLAREGGTEPRSLRPSPSRDPRPRARRGLGTTTRSTRMRSSSRACAWPSGSLVPGAPVIVDDSDWEQVARGDRRLPRGAAASANAPHCGRQGPWVAALVGGDGSPRLGRLSAATFHESSGGD